MPIDPDTLGPLGPLGPRGPLGPLGHRGSRGPLGPAAPLAAILAGGRNTRYGGLKALEEVGGIRIVDRVHAALSRASPDLPLVLIANQPEDYASVPLPSRPDVLAGLGALGGIHAALSWAREEARAGALVVACDMPFVSADLLGRLLDEAGSGAGSAHAVDAVVPESGGRRGVEPLCAYYSVACLAAIEAAAGRGDRRVIAFYDDVALRRLPLDDVRRYGDPSELFMNVNTHDERTRAEAIAARAD